MTQDGTAIARANAEERMLGKLTRSLTEDIAPLLAPDVAYGDTKRSTPSNACGPHSSLA